MRAAGNFSCIAGIFLVVVCFLIFLIDYLPVPTTDGQEFAATQPALVVVTTTAEQEFVFAQHDDNQQAVSSSAMQDLSEMEEVTVDAADKEQVKEMSTYSKRRIAAKHKRRREKEKATNDNPIYVTTSPQCGLDCDKKRESEGAGSHTAQN
jgi:hypothetical protein